MSTPLDDLPPISRAALHLYQLYDLSNSIDLERARRNLSTPTERVRPVASRGARIEIAQLPLEIGLGTCPLALGGSELRAELHARIYDLGIVALRLIIALPKPLEWSAAVDVLAEVQTYSAPIMAAFQQSFELLRTTLGSAIERANERVRTEDYRILLIEQLGSSLPASQLVHHPTLLRAALGERKPLSAFAATLATTLSYYEDDLILLTWASAVVIEPDAVAREDAALLLEFANVQLLAFRAYDDEVERELQQLAPRMAARSHQPAWVRLRSSSHILREIHSLIADITDTRGHFDNALKVTEDIYWNRVYAAVIAVLRVDVWRRSIAETVDVLRQMAALLHDEAQDAWTSLLEVLVIVLIAVELIVAVLGWLGLR